MPSSKDGTMQQHQTGKVLSVSPTMTVKSELEQWYKSVLNGLSGCGLVHVIKKIGDLSTMDENTKIVVNKLFVNLLAEDDVRSNAQNAEVYNSMTLEPSVRLAMQTERADGRGRRSASAAAFTEIPRHRF